MRRHAFTLSDTLTALALGVLLFVYSYSMIGCGDSGKDKAAATDGGTDSKDLNKQLKETQEKLAREQRINRQMQNSTHLRGIHSGMILYAHGNRDFYPGLNADGSKATLKIDASEGIYGFGTADGSLVAYRLGVLLRGNYFSPEYMISPAETNSAIKPVKVGVNFLDGAAYSYALLNISDLKAPRTGEWKVTNSSRSVIVSDRNIGSGATGTAAASIHTENNAGWKGSVCYNDNHANFETSDVIKTEYSLKGEVVADKLFSDAETPVGGVKGADAAMVFKAGDSYVNQQP